jgi:hypothetical protein
VRVIKKIIPSFFKPYLLRINSFFTKTINDNKNEAIRNSHSLLVEKLREKKSIKVVFLVLHDSVWKYEKLYELLKEDKNFIPQIVVIPVLDENNIDWDNYNRTLNYFNTNKYNCIGTYNELKEEWIDIKTDAKPDLVFFTNPHKLTFDKYYIHNFKDKLTCYSSYAFVVIHLLELHYNQKFHKVLWKYFLETKQHQTYLSSFNKENQTNGFISGFPGLDKIFDEDFKPQQVWKKHSESKTYKVIWAPHHTISGQDSGLNYSSFMLYYQFFIDLLVENKNIQVAFKPHPLLKTKLYKNEEWGKQKTDNYYNQWSALPNGQLEESNYIDLFYLSDAMILDSASFIVEYLYFDKPILFTMKDDEIKERFNSFGKKVFDYLCTGKSNEDLNRFLQNQVIKENDLMKDKRNTFFKEEILPKNGKTASKNIYDQIKKELC